MKENETPQQLALLPSPKPSSPRSSSPKSSAHVPLQFRLDEATRRRGLRHVAELRRVLTARQATKATDAPRTSAPRRAA